MQIEETCMTIQLANKEYISLLGIVTNVEVLLEKIKCPIEFVLLACPRDNFVLLYLVVLPYTQLELKLICLERK
jgi:hypothetical protein